LGLEMGGGLVCGGAKERGGAGGGGVHSGHLQCIVAICSA